MQKNHYIHLLKHRSFMSFWIATTLLRLSSNILQFALAIYVLNLTGSAFVYSTVLSIIILPRIFCTSIAGYFADFADSIRILRWGTLGLSGLMGCFFVIHTLIYSMNVPLIYILVICLELCETFIAPSEGKVLLCIVEKDELAPASKISSLDDGIVEILSPIIASLFYGLLGMTSVLAIAFVLEAIAFMLTMAIRPHANALPLNNEEIVKQQTFTLKNVVGAYKETILCLGRYRYIIGIILFAPLFNFFINPLFSVTAPYYFLVTAKSGQNMYAMFNVAMGIAGLVAPFLSMILISDEKEYKTNKWGTVSCTVVLVCTIGFLCFGANFISTNGMLYILTGTMSLIVAIITIMNIATSITIKKHIPREIVGRVISMIQLCATISIPLGQLFYGLCTDGFSIIVSLLISVVGLIITFVVVVKTYTMIDRKCDD